ncbi:MAG: septal ring lytic transglycosylase RlpA family protein [Candidatus Omnitrophota bacterium]
MRLCLKVLFFVFFAAMLKLCSDASIVPIYGRASWYCEQSPGINLRTASNEIFDHNILTCATWGFPFDTILEVKNVNNGRKVLVRVNDRGPAKRLYQEGRVVDLTKAAFEEIEDPDKGLAEVEVRVVK